MQTAEAILALEAKYVFRILVIQSPGCQESQTLKVSSEKQCPTTWSHNSL